MMHLLAIEWMKVKKYLTFWIMTGMFALLLPFWNYGINDGFLKVGNGNIDLLDKAYSFDHVWDNMGWWTSIFVVFLAILTIIITSNEYTFRTSRQNIIDGWTRLQFFHAKWLMVVAFALCTTVYVFFVGLCFGLANDTVAHFPGDVGKLFYVFVLSLDYYSFSLMIAFFFKRSGIAIGIFFLYNMIIEKLLQSFINWRWDFEAGNFLPLQASDKLLPFPLMQMAKTLLQVKETIPPYWYVMASFGWIIIYYLVTRFRLLRTDW